MLEFASALLASGQRASTPDARDRVLVDAFRAGLTWGAGVIEHTTTSNAGAAP